LNVQRPDLTTIPKTPGVYRYLGADGSVLYVGKAKDLRSRISSYFSKDVHPRICTMLEQAEALTWLVCASEAEALLIEHAFIRDLQPPFNIKLRFDEHAYPYVALTRHEIPRIMTWHGDEHSASGITRQTTGTPVQVKVRRSPKRVVDRYGPYPNASHAHALRDVIERVWQLRPCKDSKLEFHQQAGHACLLGEMNRCCAPCVSPTGYEERVNAARSLLDGNTKLTEGLLTEEMEEAANSRAYEHAALLRDRLDAVRSLSSRAVPTEVRGQVDAVALIADERFISGQLLSITNGVLRGCPTYSLDLSALFDNIDPDASALDAVIASAYAQRTPAATVLVERLPTPVSLALIHDLNPAAVVRLARTAQERSLIELTKENAKAALDRTKVERVIDPGVRDRELHELALVLGLSEPPLRIECLDISHFQGSNTVASFAVLEHGVPRPKAHRRMKLQDRADDPASIKEAVTRRVRHLHTVPVQVDVEGTPPSASNRTGDWSLQTRPQLLLIDGGVHQLNAALEAFKETGVEIAVASLSKRLEEVWLPGKAAPLRLPLDSPALFVLQRARDEAHRTSIRYQRSLRTLDIPLLDGVRGLGKKRRDRLVQEAGSLAALRAWPKSRFLACSWLPTDVAEAAWHALNRTPSLNGSTDVAPQDLP
jgi:excinuclease ABC subunit C